MRTKASRIMGLVFATLGAFALLGCAMHSLNEACSTTTRPDLAFDVDSSTSDGRDAYLQGYVLRSSDPTAVAAGQDTKIAGWISNAEFVEIWKEGDKDWQMLICPAANPGPANPNHWSNCPPLIQHTSTGNFALTRAADGSLHFYFLSIGSSTTLQTCDYDPSVPRCPNGTTFINHDIHDFSINGAGSMIAYAENVGNTTQMFIFSVDAGSTVGAIATPPAAAQAYLSAWHPTAAPQDVVAYVYSVGSLDGDPEYNIGISLVDPTRLSPGTTNTIPALSSNITTLQHGHHSVFPVWDPSGTSLVVAACMKSDGSYDAPGDCAPSGVTALLLLTPKAGLGSWEQAVAAQPPAAHLEDIVDVTVLTDPAKLYGPSFPSFSGAGQLIFTSDTPSVGTIYLMDPTNPSGVQSIYCPSAGIAACKAAMGATADCFVENLHANPFTSSQPNVRSRHRGMSTAGAGIYGSPRSK